MEIVLNKIVPNAITDQIMMFVGKKTKTKNKNDRKSEMMIKNVKLKFISRKANHVFDGTCDYFRITDETLISSRKFQEFINLVDYSPIWKTESDDYLLKVHMSRSIDKPIKNDYIADLKLYKYYDNTGRGNFGKDICYNAGLTNINKVVVKQCNDLLMDD
jgi:hypothetical protein